MFLASRKEAAKGREAVGKMEEQPVVNRWGLDTIAEEEEE